MIRRTIAAERGYSVVIWDDEYRGHFEHDGEAMGGLWFEGKELTDYDGAYELPRPVAAALRADGFTVGPEFD